MNGWRYIFNTCTGLFTESHMDYDIERPRDQPSLAEMTESAIKILNKSPEGFFLLVEGSLSNNSFMKISYIVYKIISFY